MNSENPVKSVGLLTPDLSLPAEPPRYAIRMPGGVGGLLSDGESYPDIYFMFISLIFRKVTTEKNFPQTLLNSTLSLIIVFLLFPMLIQH